MKLEPGAHLEGDGLAVLADFITFSHAAHQVLQIFRFKHHDSMDGMNADFQVMSLASMNMTSDKGETHHIMVNLSQADGGAPIKDAVGKIKVVGPDGKEQISPLKNYNGILAGNFTFKEPGKYGVICLLKNEDKKPVFKFWYHHM